MMRWVVSVLALVVLAVGPLRADVAPFPSWRVVTSNTVTHAEQAGDAVYLGGGFTKIGRSVPYFTGLLDAGTLSLAPGMGCAQRFTTALLREYVLHAPGLSDGAGLFVGPPGTAVVRVGPDCRFDRTFRLTVPAGVDFLPGEDSYSTDVVELDGRIYLHAQLQAGQVPVVVEADRATGAVIRYWVTSSWPNLRVVGATPAGRLVATTQHVYGSTVLGWFDRNTGTFDAVTPLAPFASVRHVGAVVSVLGDGRLAVFSTATLAPLPQLPIVTGSVRVHASDASRLFVFGAFQVDGVAAPRLLAFDTVTGARDTGWIAPSFLDDTLSVNSLFAGHGRLIIGADFAPGAPRDQVAVLDASTGALDPWSTPFAPFQITVVGGRLLLGHIQARDRQARNGLAAVSATTGELLPWRAAGTRATNTTFAVDPAAGFMYVSAPEGVRRLSLVTGEIDPTWRLDLQWEGAAATVSGMALHDGRLFVGGMISRARDADGAPWQPRDAVSSITTAGTLTPWRSRLRSMCSDPKGVFRRPCVTRLVVAAGRIVVRGQLQHLDTPWTPERSLVALSADTGAVDGLLPPVPLAMSANATGDAAGLYASVTLPPELFVRVDAASGVRVIGPVLQPPLVPNPTIAQYAGRLYGRVEQDAFTGESTGNPFQWSAPVATTEGVADIGLGLSWHAAIARVAPRAPRGLTASLSGAAVTLSWTPGAGDLQPMEAPPVPGGSAATSHVLLASLTPGGAPVASIPTGTADTTFTVTAPAGTFYVRVVARNAFGASAPSGEVRVDVQPGAPLAPAGLQAVVTGRSVRLEWLAPSAGWAPTGYQLEAGTAAGASNLGTIPVAGLTLAVSNVPPGRYYARVRAVNAAGASVPGNEVVIDVP